MLSQTLVANLQSPKNVANSASLLCCGGGGPANAVEVDVGEEGV